MEDTKNKTIEEIVWKRIVNDNTIIIDMPWELWYICPECKVLGETLDWSEFNWFLWCEIHRKDYPTCLCCTDIDKAIDIYLKFAKYR